MDIYSFIRIPQRFFIALNAWENFSDRVEI